VIATNRELAYLGLGGTVLDLLGGLYLGYDLLGGAQGPLALVTRAVTYSVIFALGYGLPFGTAFGLIAGVGLGVTLAVEFGRVSRHQRLYGSSPLYQTPVYGAARGVVLGLAAWHRYGGRFALVFGALSSALLWIVYWRRFAPAYDYRSHAAPVITRHRLAAAMMRALAIGIAGAFAGWLSTGNPYSAGFGLVVGAVVAVVTTLVTILSPIIEWRVDHMPERHLIAVGLALVLAGFALQSVQYVLVILGVPLQ
jgi:hypothetical protein